MMEPLKLATEPKVEHQAAMVALGRPGAGEAVAGGLRVRRHRASRDPLRRRVRRPRDLRPGHLVGGPGVRGDRERRRGRVRPRRRSPSPGDEFATGFRCAPRSPRLATSPASRQQPQRSSAVEAATPSFLDDAPPSTGRPTTVRRRRSGSRLCDEHVQALGSRSGGPRASVGTARSRRRGRVADVPAARRSSSPPALRPSATRTARWRGATSWPATPASASPRACCAATTRRSTTASGRSPAGPANCARDPNSTTAADVQSLRDAGFDDGQIFAISVFVALRIAFSIVNDALGAATRLATGRGGACRCSQRRHVRPADRRGHAEPTLSVSADRREHDQGRL